MVRRFLTAASAAGQFTGAAASPRVFFAGFTLPAGAQVTGIRATIPGGGSASDWYFVSQLSTQ